MRGPKYSPSGRVLRTQAPLPSQPSKGAVLPHHVTSMLLYCRAKKMTRAEMAMPAEKAAERTKLYYRNLLVLVDTYDSIEGTGELALDHRPR